MILENDPGLVSSFIDGTSLHNTSNPGEKIYIQAQVPNDARLNWFHDLLSRFPVEARGELKARQLVPVFLSTGRWERYNLQKSLRSIRVHITDSAPYLREAKAPLKRLLARLELETFDPRIVSNIRNMIRVNAGYFMAYDSPMARFQRKFRRYRWFSGKLLVESDFKDLGFVDFSGFRSKRGLFPIEKFTRAIAESESVFSEALSSFGSDEELGIEELQRSGMLPFRLLENLCQSHAFDKGDTSTISWIEQQRDQALKSVVTELWYVKPSPRKLLMMDSIEEIRIQAADVACGIVRYYLTLPDAHFRLAEMFDFIQLNGVQLKQIVNRKSNLLLSGS